MKKILLFFIAMSAFINTSFVGFTKTPSLACQTAQNITLDKLDNIVVIDGDTIRADITLGHSIILKNQSIRLLGYDAWESARYRKTVHITNEEIKKGLVAKLELDKIIGKSKIVCLTDNGRDNYGRCLGYLKLVQQDGSMLCVETWMKKNGHQRTK